MKAAETRNVVVTYIFGAVGTVAAVWSLLASYREDPEWRAYMRSSPM